MADGNLTARLKRITETSGFHAAVVAVIIANAIVVGLETSRPLATAHAALFASAHAVVLALFVAELVLRIAAHGFRLGAFLRDGWNAFDFLVVALSVVPGVGSFATVARIARVLRIVRLVSVSPKLRLIIGTMTRSIPSLGHVSLLLALLLYCYAVVGVHLFGASDPERWGSLGKALLTLFQILTLEGWVDVQGAVMAGHHWAWVYFASFVVVAVFVVVNLFIAVVLNNLDELREEERQAAIAEQARLRPEAQREVEQHLAALRADLDRLEAHYRRQKPPQLG